MLGIYITAGYPNPEITIQALKILDEEEVDLIELGVPFSDPLADGPVIQRASYEALKQGMNLDKIFDLVKEAKKSETKSKSTKGLNSIILFSYYNPLFIYGFDKLIQRCVETNIQGILIPDLPVDEAKDLVVKFNNAGLDFILLAAVTSTDERVEQIASLSNPWIYLVSRAGVTGSSRDIQALQLSASSEKENQTKIQNIIKQIKKSQPNKIIGLGFGIDSREKVNEAIALGADMAIIGTKAIRVLEACDESLNCFRGFIRALKEPMPAK